MTTSMKVTVAIIVGGALGIAGCLTVPLGDTGGVDTATANKLSHDVPLYDSSKLTGNYLKVGSISASGCDNSFLGGPGREMVLAKLREEAESMGANGITDLSCGHGSTSELGGCFSSTTCSATALKVVNGTDSN
jgi:hypothetical protein